MLPQGGFGMPEGTVPPDGSGMIPPMTPPPDGSGMIPPMTPPPDGSGMTPPTMPPGGSGMMPPPDGSCNLVGCGPEFRELVPLEDRFGDTISLVIDACRNEHCMTAMLEVQREELGPGTGRGVEVPHPDSSDREGSPILTASLNGMNAPGTLNLEVTWRLWSRMDAHDGDDYRIRVTDSGGLLLSSRDVTVSYRDQVIDACTSCLVAVPADAGD
jgi:hypothetical protein